jgi:hypothetical protein
MTAIEVCRTAALGGHLERCDCCNHERPCYDSCRDRHCPKCQSLARAEWVEKRTSEVLPTHYFHVVFTIPEQVASIAYQNKDLRLRHSLPSDCRDLAFNTNTLTRQLDG